MTTYRIPQLYIPSNACNDNDDDDDGDGDGDDDDTDDDGDEVYK